MRLRTAGPWADAAVIGSVLAVGVLIAGLLDNPDSVSIADIPGCSSVQPAPEPVRFSFGYAGYPQYDNPTYPWLTGPKATALTRSLAAALPADAAVAFAAPSESLYFQPIMDFSNGDLPEGVSADEFGGDSEATGQVSRGSAAGTLSVSVKQLRDPVPPCTEGQLDRRTLSDGTVVDTYEDASAGRLAAAYTPDKSRITATVDDSTGTGKSDHSGHLPFTVDDLVAIVSNPGLRVSAPVPAGTPAPPLPCSTDSSRAGPPIGREKLAAMNAALNNSTNIALPQPLGSLNLAESDPHERMRNVAAGTGTTRSTTALDLAGRAVDGGRRTHGFASRGAGDHAARRFDHCAVPRLGLRHQAVGSQGFGVRAQRVTQQ